MNGAVVVAVVAVTVVQMARNEIVGVVAVRNGFVAAAVAVNVVRVVRAARVGRGARDWVRRPDVERAFVDVSVVRVVQMAFVDVVDVVIVFDGGVPAAGAVNVSVA